MKKSFSDSGLSVLTVFQRTLVSGLLALAVCVSPLFAVETIVVGDVVNETTGEPISNVNIHFRGTKIGTTTDETGAFVLRVDMIAKSQLVFSAVGYHTQRFDIEPGSMSGLQVGLRERVAILQEFVATPGENPALALLREVRAHRADNDRTLHPDQGNVVRREEHLYISQIQRRHLRRALWRSLQSGYIQQDDSSFIMPLYRETQTFRLQGEAMIPANDQQSQALVLTSTNYSALLVTQGNLNFYQNTVSLFNRAFLSPLASSGNMYYQYFLADSVADEQGKRYIIHFKTRNPFYATFNGELSIDSATFALRSIQAYVPVESSVNYLSSLHISQEIAPDNSLAEEHLSTILDFAVSAAGAPNDSTRIFPTILLTHSLKSKSVSGLTGAAGLPSNSVSGLNTDSAFAALDSLPIIRTARWFATIATTGYIPTGTPVDFGHIEEILQVNRHEGVHIGLPLRTNERFSRVVSLEASVGYGFRDRAAKGMGRISVNLPTPQVNQLQLEYHDRYVWSEVDDFSRLMYENSMGWGTMDFTAYAFEALRRDTFCHNSAMRERQIQLHWFADWGERLSAQDNLSIETHAYIRAGWHNSGYHLTTNIFAPYSFQSFNGIVRLSWGERKYDGFFMRRYGYSPRYPVLFLGAEFGHWSPVTDNPSPVTHNLYAHLRVLLTHHAQLGMGGTLTYALQAGAIFGSVPSTLLWQAGGNQGYAYDPYRFTLLHNGELTADKYTALHAEWNGQGILFNLIPGIRFLHLRELVEAKLAYGYLSNSVSGLTSNSANGLTGAAGHKVYAEVGIGIGNILRVCDLYSVWSLVPTTSPLSAQAPGSSKWAIRFRIHLGL